MANNKIQIKRSASTGIPTSLSAGELAFSNATGGSGVLFIGSTDGGTVVPIAGVRNPGVLTANQALVVNSTSAIDKVIVANLVPTSIWANGAAGSAGDVLTSNSTGVYWKAPSAGVAGSDTQVQFNDGGTLAGDSGLTYNKTSDTLSTNTVLATSTVNAAVLSVGSWVVANTGGVYTSGVVNGDIIRVGTNIVSNTTQFTLASGIKFAANGAAGSANQVLRSDSSGVAYWSDDAGDISAVTAGSGLTGGGTSGDVTLDVGSGNGISVSTDAVAVNANDGIVANTSGLFVKAGTGVTVNATGVHIGQSVGTTDNVTFANVVTTDLTINGNTTLGDSGSDRITFNSLVTGNIWPSSNQAYDIGSNTLRWNNLYANSLTITKNATFGGNVSVDGTLTVTGNVITTNVQSVIVSDPMIYLAGNNYTSDLLDIGFAGNYNDGTDRHTGLFRDHTDGYWKLFYNLTQELSGNNDVDVNDASYRTATLVAYLASGGLSTNTTSANLVANSTYSVGIVANTLTLSTALAGTSGGTGKSSVTNNALLVGNSSNGYNELTLGTSGYVLQSNGSALVYDVLDGGTF